VKRDSNQGLSGLVAVLISAILFAGSVPASKALLDEVPPRAMAGLLFLAGGAGLLVLRLALKRIHPALRKEAPIRRGDVPILLLATLFGTILAPILYLEGLDRTSAHRTALLSNLEAVFTIGLAIIFFRERLTPATARGVVLVLIGGVVATFHRKALSGGGFAGAALVSASVLAFAIDTNVTKLLCARDPIVVAGLKGLFGGAVNLLLSESTFRGDPPALPPLALILVVGFFGYGVALAFLVFAMRRIGVARAGAVFATYPGFAFVFSWALLPETPEPKAFVAFVLMAAGLLLLFREPAAVRAASA
jgi:drug/metabolite transporter (DMT)-like permease